ncbi:MAG: hypothetical protein CL472_09285 [Acidobacteria bacterium]|nr:hypothetical protein [Acidobacteriota bacterium]
MDNENKRAAEVRRIMGQLLEKPGARRTLAMASNISEPTITKIAATGIISSVYTAACLESATNGLISAKDHVHSEARGKAVYERFPGSEILRVALQTKQTPTSVMSSLGINQHDLSVYSQPDGKPNPAVSKRIEAAIDILANIGGTNNDQR